ncbi:MAG TPA: hypothetical protein VK757_08245 [Candidatus Acidoferrum sp.]|nr:hypothetical protein [Candidatus Acidoferrum sp.]
MQYQVVGLFENYGGAEAAVRDLELAGISGEQVEVISDIDTDVRTANTAGEPSTKTREPHQSKLARLFGSGGSARNTEVSADAGEQPDFIGEQVFYANHIKKGGTVLVVRTRTEPPASRAAEILHSNGARTPGHKDGPAVQRIG